MKTKVKVRAISIAALLALSPFLFFDDRGTILSFKEAGADIGTCCQQDGAICVIPPIAVHNFYTMPPGYPCPPVWGPLPLPDPGVN